MRVLPIPPGACHSERNEVESKDLRMGLGRSDDEGAKISPLVIPPEAYFLTDEKVGKESPRNFRMFLGLFRRTKGEVDWIFLFPTFPPLPPW